VIGLDTNVLARYFIDEAGADDATVKQREAARTLLESGQGLFMPKTVALELEWVLRGYYRFSRDQVGLVFDALLNLQTLQLEDRAAIEQALAGLRAGLDFASCRACTAIASFDQRSFANPARALNLQPRVITPR